MTDFFRDKGKNLFLVMLDVSSETVILFETLFKPHQLHLAVCMVTDFVSFIYNLKTVF